MEVKKMHLLWDGGGCTCDWNSYDHYCKNNTWDNGTINPQMHLNFKQTLAV